MTAEVREEREGPRGRIKVRWVQKRTDNHNLDCELMIDAAAILLGLSRVARLVGALGEGSCSGG